MSSKLYTLHSVATLAQVFSVGLIARSWRCKLLMPPQKKVSKNTVSEHATSTAHATQGNASGVDAQTTEGWSAHRPSTCDACSYIATEHVIARWQALFWRNSKDCQHVIQGLLSLRAKGIHQHSQLQGILVQKLPPLFTPNQEDAFFAVLQQKTITDANLRDAIVDFLARWEAKHEASYRELLADSAVAREANVLLPKDLPMWRWIRSCLHGEMELIEEETSGWSIHLLPKSLLSKQIVSRYKAGIAVTTQE